MGKKYIFSNGTSNCSNVAILFPPKIDFELYEKKLTMRGECYSKKYNFNQIHMYYIIYMLPPKTISLTKTTYLLKSIMN